MRPILSAQPHFSFHNYKSVFQSRVQSFLQTFVDEDLIIMLIYLFRRVLMHAYNALLARKFLKMVRFVGYIHVFSHLNKSNFSLAE